MSAVPKLRFKEFEDDWEKYTFSKIANITDGTHQTPKYVPNGVPFYSVEHVTADQFKKTKYISEEVFLKEKSSKVPAKGDVLMTRIGNIGTAKFINWDVRASVYVSLALLKPVLNFSGKYIAYCIASETTQRNLWARTIHVAFPKKINLGDLGEVNINCPQYNEQKKIADFLAAVDDKIAGLRAREALLSQYKQGVMQKIFSQALRFKQEARSAKGATGTHKADDGRDFPDWEVINFGDVFTFMRNNSFSRACLNYESGEVRNIHYGDIHTKLSGHFKSGLVEIPYINAEEKLSSYSESDYLLEGDLVIADASEDYADIGKAIEIIDLDNVPTLAGLHTYLARPNGDRVAKGFFGFLMQTYSFRRQVMSLAQGISVLGISKTNYAKIEFELPHPDEQQKIADFLSAIDDKISIVSAQITQMQDFKKGLLQQMFV